MEKNIYDVIVIGSGPAGTSAAITAGTNGLKTLLLTAEGATADNGKQVVESVHPGVLSLLTRLKAEKNFEQCVVGTYTHINNGKQSISLNPSTEEVWTGHHILREQFRRLLLVEACNSGVEVWLNSAVSNFVIENDVVGGVQLNGKEINGKVVIDASGAKSIAVRKLKLAQQFLSEKLIVTSGRTFETMQHIENRREAYFLAQSRGWSWTAQLNDGSCYWTNLSTENNRKLFKPPYLDYMGNEQMVFIAAANMRWHLTRPLCKEGIILCGDSAGVIDPASGQGILNALLSGMIAGETAGKIVRNKAMQGWFLADYDNSLSSMFRNKASQLSAAYAQFGIAIN